MKNNIVSPSIIITLANLLNDKNNSQFGLQIVSLENPNILQSILIIRYLIPISTSTRP